MICPSCGAEFADWAHRCPYCGAVNEAVDEELYMRHMEELRERLGAVDEAAEASYRRSVHGASRKTRRLLLWLLLAGVLVACGFFAFRQLREKRIDDRAADEVRWQIDEFAALDEWYAAGEYDRIMAEFDRCTAEDPDMPLYKWQHTAFLCDFWQTYQWFADSRSALADSPPENKVYAAETVLSDAVFFCVYSSETKVEQYLENYGAGNYGISPEEAEQVAEFREDVLRFLRVDLQLSDSEIGLLTDSSDQGEAFRELCRDYAQKLAEDGVI